MYNLEIKPTADNIFKKLEKKNPKQMKIIYKKIREIRQNPYYRYKFLRKPLQGFNRVHIDKHFVLVFKVWHNIQTIEIWYYGHHDQVYKRKSL